MPRTCISSSQYFSLGKNVHVKTEYNQEVSQLGTYIPSRSIAATGTGLGSGPSTLD